MKDRESKPELTAKPRSENVPGRYKFGRWSFSADAGDLYDGHTTTRLEPQVAKLLEHFLCNQHQVISRTQLIAAVWNKRTVSDDAINRCVSILRQLLSPADKNAYIETVVRKGYIAHFPPSPEIASVPTPRIPDRRYPLLAALAVLAAIFLYTLAGRLEPSDGTARAPQRPGPPMVAVLPFASVSQSDDSEFFATGIHDDLLTQLAQLQSMRVISSTSMKEYRGVRRNMRKIGNELDADVILEGSVQIAGNRIRINAQLIDARRDEHLWAQSYDRELSPANIFEVQSEIARAIAAGLDTTLTAQDRAQLAIIPTGNMAAYRAYHRAMQFRDTPGVATYGPQTLAALEEAVALDPNFSRAWADIVTTLSFMNFSGDQPELTLRAEQALAQLQSIAPDSADYLIGQAAYVYYALKDYDRAHDIIARALLINPGDVHAVELRSWIERRQGDFDAMVASRYEVRRLDPRNPVATDNLLNLLLLTHRYNEAVGIAEASPIKTFLSAYTTQLVMLAKQPDFKDFQASMQKLCQFYKEPDCGWTAHIANRDYSAALAVLEQAQRGLIEPIASAHDIRLILTLWLMGETEFTARRWRQLQGQLLTAPAAELSPWQDLLPALAVGKNGDVDEAELLIQRWLRHKPITWPERVLSRHHACRILGMIAATQTAVQCIRDGLEEPSFVAPFLEPYLPFYDAVRAQPEFINMLAELDGYPPTAKLY